MRILVVAERRSPGLVLISLIWAVFFGGAVMGFGEFGGKGRGSGSAIEGDVAGATSCFHPRSRD